MQQIFDTHRLSYKNARLRAFKLDNKTERLHWFNITETSTEGDDVGVIIYTNEKGYVCYGRDRQRVTSLALAESAIIQVSLDGGINWPIEWIVKTDQGLAPENVGTLYYADGSVAFDPTKPGRATLRDFALASEISEGTWAEEQVYFTGSDTNNVPVTQWTKTIYANLDNADSRQLGFNLSNLRTGQLIAVRNAGQSSISILGTGPVVSLPAGTAALFMSYTQSGSIGATLRHVYMPVESNLTSYDTEYQIVGTESAQRDGSITFTDAAPVLISIEMNSINNSSCSFTINEIPAGIPKTIILTITTDITTETQKCTLRYKGHDGIIGTAKTGEGLAVRITRRTIGTNGEYIEIEPITII